MKKTVQEGQELFYIEENQIYSGHAVEVMDTPQGQDVQHRYDWRLRRPVRIF